MNRLLIIIFELFKTGLFSVGGGLATIPFLVEIGNKYGFYKYDELLTMIGVSESTPGAIGINMATYVGIKAAGILGGIFATLSLVAPSIIIIVLIARAIKKYKESIYVKAIMDSLKPMSIGFIVAAVLPILISLFKGGTIDRRALIGILLFIFLLRERLKNLHPGFIILASFFIGILIDLI